MTSIPAAEIVVDLNAIRSNVAALRTKVDRPLMAVVKADGYGHGLVPSARAAIAGGADALGVAILSEALSLRAAGIDARVLSWLAVPGSDYAAAIANQIEVSVNTDWALAEAVEAATTAGTPIDLHLKIDTGLSRGGATADEWVDLVNAAARAERDGLVRVRGVWSHFAYADSPGHPTVSRQRERLLSAVEQARTAGLSDFQTHLANSAATLYDPESWLDMVRPGIAVYGLEPTGGDPAEHGLVPAMTVRGTVALAKRVPAGSGVSYGHTYVTARETTLALVPVGYADGVPRSASNVGPVLIAGQVRTVSGRVCMDQFVIDVGDDEVRAGDPVVLWGSGAAGEPTAQDWADAVDTIHYELVTRVGGRFTRTYRGDPDE